MTKRLISCLCILHLGSAALADLNDGLVLHCPFNGNALDISGHERHGVVHGATLTQDQSGRKDSAYEFDGIDDYIDFGPVLPDMERMTVAFWIFIPAPDTVACIFADGEYVSMKFDRPGNIKLVAKQNGARLDHAFDLHESLQSKTDFSVIGRWIHLVWVMAEYHSTVYVDGVARGRYVESASNVGEHDLIVGAAYPGPTNPPPKFCWEGTISSMRFYDRLLTDSEVETLYGLEDQGANAGDGDATLLHVDDDAACDPAPKDLTVGDPNEDGSEEHPYDSIQEAIQAAEDGHTIVVRAGTYHETIDFLGKNIHVTRFDPHAEAQENQPCPTLDALYQDAVVTFANGEDPNARLSGFTITRGLGRKAGGILCSGSSPTISNCLIVGNRAESLFGGGAVYCSDGANPTFDRCTISGNYGGQAGAGFYSDGGTGTLANSILWDNLPAEIGFPMFGGTSLAPMFTYCDLSLDTLGAGNINADPLFASPGYWADASDPAVPTGPEDPAAIWVDGNYQLRKESPCIDAGDPNCVVDASQFDLDGHPRFVNDRLDIGSDEYISSEMNFVALYEGTAIPLIRDASATDPESTYTGAATVQLDAHFKLKVLGQAFAASAAGGSWTVAVSPNIIGPGMGIDVEVTVTGAGVDISKLPPTVGDIVLAEVELGAVLAP